MSDDNVGPIVRDPDEVAASSWVAAVTVTVAAAETVATVAATETVGDASAVRRSLAYENLLLPASAAVSAAAALA